MTDQPADAWWDCHFHIFDSRKYRLAPDCAYRPADATPEMFRAVCESRSISRGVLVHPSVYGTDHQSYEDTLAGQGAWLRGVAVVHADEELTSDAQLARWDGLGTVGTRINRLFPGAPTSADRVVARVRELDWHVQVLADITQDITWVTHIAGLGIPVVVDHFGHHPADALLHSPAFRNLLALMAEGTTWVKMSAPYRLSGTTWDSVDRLAEMLIAANPERVVWGSDWPHPPNPRHPFLAPDTSAVTQTLRRWLQSPQLLHQIMSVNPSVLYDRRSTAAVSAAR